MAKRDALMVVKPHYTPTYVVEDEWNGFVKGDPIKVLGERGDFTFVKVHTRNGEATDVIVHGGVYGHTTIRAFYPDQISKPTKRKRAATPTTE
jgi:hypothetical protein